MTSRARYLSTSAPLPLTVAAALLFAEPSAAQVGGPGLTGLTYAGEIENAAARANDLVFRTLEPDCNPQGVLDLMPTPEFDDIAAGGGTPGPLCNPDTFHVYANSRELTHTANALQGSGPTISSLSIDVNGLGRALRWTAAEELAAQSSLATQLANSQLATLAGRLTALRFGVGGFRAAGIYDTMRGRSPLLAQVGGNPEPVDAEPGESYTAWGGFLNYGYGSGSRAPTLLENAFDFDGSEITLGIDYRLRSNTVLGAIIGRTGQDIDFDETASTVSIVDGTIETEGSSFIVFALAEGERLTISGSLGAQSLDYAIERHIRYASLNPQVPGQNSIANSTPEAEVAMATFSLSYAFSWTKFMLEPYVTVEHIDVTVDTFAEQRSIDRFSNTADSRRFDLVASRQDVESLEASLGLRFQYVLTPRFGVIAPFWSLAMHREREDKSRAITTGYAALADVLGTTTFVLPTDEPDDVYYTAAVGFSTVLRGGRERQLDGPIVGGLSAFVQMAAVASREHYDDQVFVAGLRYEF